MQKAMNITYEIGGKLYLNITNKCPCNCTFCIRNNGDGAYGSDPLWLEHQPTAEEVIAAGANSRCGLLINSSRGILYASSGPDFAEKAAAAAAATARL